MNTGMARAIISATALRRSASTLLTTYKGIEMGKYVLAWLLGVPGVVLVLIYIFMH